MAKLTKLQREILEASLEVVNTHGKNIKPVSCNLADRAIIGEFGKSYTKFQTQMYALFDAGILENSYRGLMAWINVDKARAALASNAF